jgi:predicted lipoprotein with Yx(FWY)xxD motif
MDVGHTYFVALKDGETDEKAIKRATGSAQRARKGDKSKKFTARMVDHPDTGDRVVGVWRIA